MSEFESYLQIQKNYSKHTIIAYLGDLNQFFDFQGDLSKDISHYLSSKSVRKWIRKLSEHNLQSKSIHRKVSSLNTYANFLFVQGYISEVLDISVQLPKNKKPLPTYVKVKEINHLLDTLEKLAVEYEDWLELTIISTFYNTGIRRSELINLKEIDYNSNKKEIKVFGKGAKERIVPINSEFANLLDQFIELKKAKSIVSNYIFCNFEGGKLGDKWVYSVINKLLFNTHVGKKSPHVLRHSFATHLLQNGADINAIKELLGHSSLSATQLYAQTDIAQLKKVYKNTHPFSD